MLLRTGRRAQFVRALVRQQPAAHTLLVLLLDDVVHFVPVRQQVLLFDVVRAWVSLVPAVSARVRARAGRIVCDGLFTNKWKELAVSQWNQVEAIIVAFPLKVSTETRDTAGDAAAQLAVIKTKPIRLLRDPDGGSFCLFWDPTSRFGGASMEPGTVRRLPPA